MDWLAYFYMELPYKDISQEHLLNDDKDCPNQHHNSHKLYNGMGLVVLSLTKSQKKKKDLKKKTWLELPNEGEVLVEQILPS